MLITTTQELSLYIPSHVMSSIEPLQGFLQQAERTVVMPIVGRDLYKALSDRYKGLNMPEDITADETANPSGHSPEEQAWIRLIKACQMPMVFKALYDGAHIQGVSVNEAGINTMTTEGYPEAKTEKLDNYRKSCYAKWHEGIEQLLLLLEEDARGELYQVEETRQPEEIEGETGHTIKSHFKELWKKSKYYYLQAGRLIRTATEFDRYVSIAERRERFIALASDLAYCEDMSIRPEMGDAMMERIISKNHNGGASSLERRVYESLQRTLAFMVEARNPLFKRADARNDAELSMRTTIEMIKRNAEELMPEYETCAFYEAVPTEQETVARFVNGSDKAIFVPPFLKL